MSYRTPQRLLWHQRSYARQRLRRQGQHHHAYATASAHHERVAFFFKQWGGRSPKSGGRELDGRTWDEFPAFAPAAGP